LEADEMIKITHGGIEMEEPMVKGEREDGVEVDERGGLVGEIAPPERGLG
jgi:hypothetical protein